jgi:hypothetical protein
MRSRATNANPTNPFPIQGVGKFGRSRVARNHEIVSSNLTALTIPHTRTTFGMQRWQ